MLVYVSQKRVPLLFLAITLANVDRL